MSSVLNSWLSSSWPLWRTRRWGFPGWASRWPLCHGRAGRCCRSPTGPPSSGPGSRLPSRCQTGSRRGCPQSASGQNEPAASTSAKETHREIYSFNVEHLSTELHCVTTCILDSCCKNKLDFASDVYSFKMLLWELNPIKHSCGCSNIKHQMDHFKCVSKVLHIFPCSSALHTVTVCVTLTAVGLILTLNTIHELESFSPVVLMVRVSGVWPPSSG